MKKTFTLKGRNSLTLEVPVLYRTKNFVLHRTWGCIKKDYNSKARTYAITWTNNIEAVRAFTIYDSSIKKCKYLVDIIQEHPIDYDLKLNEFQACNDYKSFTNLIREIRHDPNKAYNKGKLWYTLNQWGNYESD